MLSIREYAPEDLDQLLNIWEKAARVGHSFLSEGDLHDQKFQVREVYLPKTENWVAWRNGQPLGFISLVDSLIGGLFFDPGAHRLGIGRSLIELAASRKGALQVEVYAKNEVALTFYHRMKFVEECRRPNDDQGRALELVKLRRACSVEQASERSQPS